MKLARYARQLLNDETISTAFNAVIADLERSLYDAPTPEDRERIFQERMAVVRVRQRLVEWVSDLELEENNDEH